ncbi:hypothetical protein B0I37DRAFT_403474 [Chaetomium sp. MPI-CAGE-AT-0009]|nr:hypothetical protein B0I37DRAFT_403474 [Chaetomium sp. MPI-CAGE-AT-0009]
MDRIPNEIRMGIARHLRGESDREALAAVSPIWKKIVERDDKLRTPTIDESKRRGMCAAEFLALFESTGLRRRQFLEEVRLDHFMGAAAYHEACCHVTADVHLHGDEFDTCVGRLLEGLRDIRERSVDAGLKAPPFSLSFRIREEDWKQCSGSHTNQEVHRAVTSHLDKLFPFDFLNLPNFPLFKTGVDELCFTGQGLLQRFGVISLRVMIELLDGLRVLRFNFEESSFWSRWEKSSLRYEIVCLLQGLPNGSPLEEIHVHMGRQSMRNELKFPAAGMEYDRITDMFGSLSALSSLTVLRLSGQFSVNPRCFDRIRATNPFPALTTFHLGIGPETNSSSWFFIKDKTSRAWDKAAKDPEWAECVELTRAGAYAQDLLPGPEDEDSDEEDDFGEFGREDVKRNRTLPHNATLGRLLLEAARAAERMPRIENFSICLEDNFSEDETPRPFVPPFLTRVFEMHFTRAAEGDVNPTLTWKLGQKVDHWQPAGIVLDAWRAAARMRAGMELEISYIE